jgi:multiple sugar transport system substrate-binding protein
MKAWLVPALLAAALAASCGGSEERSAVRAAGEITFLVFGEPEELRAYRNVIDAYEAKVPDVTVRLIEASDRADLIARLATSFAGGKPPDLFLLNYRFYGQFAARGVLEPIEGRVASSDVFEEGDFYREALDAFRFGGTLTCLPQNISSLVVYYNRDLFREAGVAEPETGWAWSDMVEKARALTVDEDGDGKAEQYGLGVEASLIRLAPFVWSNGGELLDDDERPTRFALDTPAALGALREFFALRRVHGVIPSHEEVEAEDDESRFLNGRSAMVLSSRRATPSFRTIESFDWDIAALPSFAQPAGILHSDAYCLTKASENKGAAWSFMEFALGPEGQRLTAAAGRTVPSLRQVAESDAFLDPDAKPANSRVFLDTIPVIRQVPSISTWPEIEDAASVILVGAMYGDEPVEDVPAKLRAATDGIFARAEG